MERLAGRYELGDALGQGRSTVYRGVDTRLRRRVAIKRVSLLPGQEDESAVRARALREARAAARLSHPSVVTVYDVVEEPGIVWLIMELVHGPSLATLVAEQGPLSHGRAAQLGLEVLGALEAAHGVGVVHRDVKPANVLVPESGPAKLTDFGVATIRDESRVTATGMIVGSPSYMAPEQATGGEITAATDRWSLGALLYFAVEGEPPFWAANALATAAAVVNGEPRAPERPGPLTPVLARLLTKNPVARAQAGEVRAALSRVARIERARGEPTAVALPATPRERMPNADRESGPAGAPVPRSTDAPAVDDTAVTAPDEDRPAAAASAADPAVEDTPVSGADRPAASAADPAVAVPAVWGPNRPADPRAAGGWAADPAVDDTSAVDDAAALAPGADRLAEPAPNTAPAVDADPRADDRTVSDPNSSVAAAADHAVDDAAALAFGTDRLAEPAPATGRSAGPTVHEPAGSQPDSHGASDPTPTPREFVSLGAPRRPDRSKSAGRRGRAAVLAMALASLVAAAFAVPTLADDGGDGWDDGLESAASSTTATTAADDGSEPTTTAPQTTDTTAAAQPAIPAGWVAYRDPSGTYSIAHPPGWRVEPRAHNRIDFIDPASGSFLRVEWTDTPGPDAAGAWFELEPGFASNNAGYERIRIESVPYRDYDAALWEFRHQGGGQTLHTGNLGFLANGRGYALMLRTPEGLWANSQGLFEQLKQSFQPT
jgi:eukaryotic-like serine/threonine-protein kinase